LPQHTIAFKRKKRYNNVMNSPESEFPKVYDGKYVIDTKAITSESDLEEANRHLRALGELGAGVLQDAQAHDRRNWATSQDFEQTAEDTGITPKAASNSIFNGLVRLGIKVDGFETRQSGIAVPTLQHTLQMFQTQETPRLAIHGIRAEQALLLSSEVVLAKLR
jgi:hypothetical protein